MARPTGEEPALRALFEKALGEEVRAVETLRSDGSSRRLYRMIGPERTAVAVAHDDPAENAAFVGFTRHFGACGLPVPEILADDLDRGIYLETDLGDVTLASLVRRSKEEGLFPGAVEPLYREVIRQLPRFQIEGGEGLDYALCYQGAEFDAAAMVRDLHYFRDCFLGEFFREGWDRAGLEEDFIALAGRLDRAERSFFLYRDFQSRNVMIVGGSPFFIDYQSGRRGALPYDLAALLYDARADLGEGFRGALLEAYLGEVGARLPIDSVRFRRFYPGFALVRILQALGAYGNLGRRKGKRRFLESIPYAVRNLGVLLRSPRLFDDLPVLRGLLARMAEDPESFCARGEAR